MNRIKWEWALYQCRRAASKGYLVAKKNLDGVKMDINQVSTDLTQSMANLDNGRVRTADVIGQLQKQLKQVIVELYALQERSRDLLEEKRAQSDKFSIALFGRTMAGKSTLMEILTNGDGLSIGKGGQRTTRDVRSYDWEGLRVTDVPGIAAFEGEEDEKLAFEAAAQSDLVLFLITDDAPQNEEAECFARVRRLGKPILGICNVKAALNDEDDVRLFLSKNWFHRDHRRLGEIVEQFHEFAKKYSPGARIYFVYTHLRSKFLSQQPEYRSQQDELGHASLFAQVEKQIISVVKGRGKFLRWKSYIDSAVTPVLDFSDKMLDFSAENSSSGRVYIDKHRQFKSWAEGFRENSKERINSFISKEINLLRAKIPEFAEDNYDKSDAGARWDRLVKEQGIERKEKKLATGLQKECKEKLSEIARQLDVELELVGKLAGDRRISMDAIFDSKRAWNWGTLLLSSGLAIAALFTTAGTGTLAVLIGTLRGGLSWVFDDGQEKASRQREDIEKKLNRDVNKIERKLRKEFNNWFRNLWEKQVAVLLWSFSPVISSLFDLADAQRNLAWKLNKQQKSLHRALINEALGQLGCSDNEVDVLDIARVPGLAVMLLIEPNTTFPMDVRKKLEEMLGEKVWFVINTRDQASILAQAIGRDCDRNKVSIERDIQVAHVPVGDLDAVGISRIRLAQQLTELHVMK